jgi:signal transduction histidine kinase
LVLVALATSSMIIVAFLVPLAILIQKLAQDQAINDARSDAQSLSAFFINAPSETEVPPLLIGTSAGQEGRVTVFFAKDRSIPKNQPADDNVQTAFDSKSSFTARTDGGVDVFSAVVRNDSSSVWVIRVFVPNALLRSGVLESWLALSVVAIVLLLVSLVVADRLGRSIVRPVKELAATARRLSAGDQMARVKPDGPPEVADVGYAMNGLANRIDTLLTNERELVADLSHRLRTPLTALRLDAESVEGTDVGERVLADVEAMEGAVDSLIRQVRAPRSPQASVCDLVATVAERAAFWAALAEDQGRAWKVTLPPGPVMIAAGAAELEAALDALFGNIFEHTPETAGATVTVDVSDDRASLVIDDGGTGFPSDAVLVRGVSGGRSTGLGLDIARRTVRSAGGNIEVANRPGGGGRVRATFPVLRPLADANGAPATRRRHERVAIPRSRVGTD